MDSIRAKYVEEGVEDYYTNHGSEYSNPHKSRVIQIIHEIWEKWKLPRNEILDLAAGSGEVTNALRQIGIKDSVGCDPFTFEAYESNIGEKCERFSFEDIIEGCYSERHFNVIICSYAMHLASKSKLPVICMNLASISNILIIITPHKRPVLTEEWGWKKVEDIKLERTSAILYKSLYI